METEPLPANERLAAHYDGIATRALLQAALRLAETDGESLDVRIWEARFRLGMAERYAKKAAGLRSAEEQTPFFRGTT